MVAFDQRYEEDVKRMTRTRKNPAVPIIAQCALGFFPAPSALTKLLIAAGTDAFTSRDYRKSLAPAVGKTIRTR
jgi:hypothetical protein